MDFGKFVIFTLISSMEYITCFILIFTLFRFNFRWYKVQIAFVCLSLSYVSFTLREDGLDAAAPFVQMALLIVFLWLLFRIALGYAALMGLVGYLGYGVIQAVVLLLLDVSLPVNYSSYSTTVLVSILSSIISCMIALFISRRIKRKNSGYSFVPDTDRMVISLIKKGNLFLAGFVAILLIGTCISYYFTVRVGGNISFLVAFIVLLTTTTIILIGFSNKKERTEVNGDD